MKRRVILSVSKSLQRRKSSAKGKIEIARSVQIKIPAIVTLRPNKNGFSVFFLKKGYAKEKNTLSKNNAPTPPIIGK